MSMLNTDKRQIDCGGNAARNVSVREKSRADVLLDYLFPPSCVCCGTLIPPDGDQDCFCESCYERLLRASVPHFRRIEIGDRRVAVLTAMSFSTAPDCPSRALILSMKNVRTSRSAYFSAQRLRSIMHMLPLGEGTVIAYVPRSRSGRRRYGFDQMETVAVRLSRMTGCRLCRALKIPRRAYRRVSAPRRAYVRYAENISCARDIPSAYAVRIYCLSTMYARQVRRYTNVRACCLRRAARMYSLCASPMQRTILFDLILYS